MHPTTTIIRTACLAVSLPLLSASVDAQNCTADQWEGDDTCVTAQIITTDTLCRANATLQLGDDDWYEVTLPPSERLELGVRAEAGAVIELSAFSTCSPLLLAEDVGNTPNIQITNNDLVPLIVRTRIELILGAPVNCAFYDLSMARTPITSICVLDDQEPNNCPDSAAPLSEGHYTGLTVHPNNPDWYEIEISGRKTIEIVRPSTVPNIQLQLFEAGGAFVDFDSNVVRVTNENFTTESYRLLVAETGSSDTCRSYSLRVNVLDEFEYYCFGSGESSPGCTSCPCNNDAIGQIGGCLNSQGFSAAIAVGGNASVANDSLNFVMVSANPNTFAILVSGDFRAPNNPLNLCFGQATGILASSFDGLRCTVGNVQRHGVRATDSLGNVGVTNARWGPPNGPTGGILAQGGFSAGQARNFQVVYRESVDQVCGRGQNTTQAVHVIVRP